eukprot:14582.XXX_929701_928652_1 [CDS] Oithona nana genome sequencing.
MLLNFLEISAKPFFTKAARMSSSKSLTLIVARHGQTASNLEQRLQGQIDTPLNETGERQAKAAGQALRSFRFDKAYSSDLKRAKTTCAFILDANIKSSITSKEINESPEVKERSFGVMENTLVSEFRALAAQQNCQNWINYVPEGAESRDDVRKRARKFLKETLTQDVNLQIEGEKQPQILVVSHGGLLRELFGVIFEEFKCELPSQCQPGDYKILAKNTSWSRFDLDVSMQGDSKIQNLICTELNNAKHLEDIE